MDSPGFSYCWSAKNWNVNIANYTFAFLTLQVHLGYQQVLERFVQEITAASPSQLEALRDKLPMIWGQITKDYPQHATRESGMLDRFYKR